MQLAAVPVRETFKQKKRLRRGYTKLTTPAMHYGATTGEYRLNHRVSSKSFHKSRQVASERKQQNSD